MDALSSIVGKLSEENDRLKTLVSCLEDENQNLLHRLMKEEARSNQLRKTIWNLKEAFHCNCDGVLNHHPECDSQ